MYDIGTIITIIVTFLFAGAVKGIVGLGLPTVSLALLTVAIDLPSAMALLLVPSFVTNLWQALAGGNGAAMLRRFWPFFLMAAITVWIGALALTRVDLALLSALLGGLLVVYAAVNLAGPTLNIPIRHEAWLGVCLGAVNGILTGMTGSFVVPGVIYLQSLGLKRDALVQAMGALFLVSTLALGLALKRYDLLTAGQAVHSIAALIPAVLGMVIGQRIRQTLPEQIFRHIFFGSLLALGLYILIRALNWTA